MYIRYIYIEKEDIAFCFTTTTSVNDEYYEDNEDYEHEEDENDVYLTIFNFQTKILIGTGVDLSKECDT